MTKRTSKPIMQTGSIKRHRQTKRVISNNIIEIVGLARVFVHEPALSDHWRRDHHSHLLVHGFSIYLSEKKMVCFTHDETV
nr:hypothetical protein [uncultured Cohaesibacter sp.]